MSVKDLLLEKKVLEDKLAKLQKAVTEATRKHALALKAHEDAEKELVDARDALRKLSFTDVDKAQQAARQILIEADSLLEDAGRSVLSGVEKKALQVT